MSHKPSVIGSGKDLRQTWVGMLARCYRPTATGYKDYGGRGITVCDRWRDAVSGFKNFRDDMGERPEGKTLDRINVSGNYTPSNCRWATHQEQMDNRRSPSITARLDAARRNRERAFNERDRLLAIVSTMYPSHLSRSKRKDVNWRYIVCVHLPQGQVAWRMPDEDIERLFSHLPIVDDDWDGHKPDDKLTRMEALIDAQPNAPR